MKNAAQIPAVCACAILILCQSGRVTAQGSLAAVVEEIHGTVHWRRNANAKQERLDRKTHTGRRLHTGEYVRVARGGLLRIRLGRESIVVPAGVWFPIPQPVLSRSDPFMRMFAVYMDMEGVTRSTPLQIFSPADGGVAPPKPFVIRWVPTVPGCKLSLVIMDVGRRQRVWRQDGVEGSSGSLSPSGAEKELLSHRAKFGEVVLELRALDSCGVESRVSFSLLTAGSESALEQELTFWDKEIGSLIGHLGRASVYSRYRMFPQAAEEYESALKLAPDSHDLLARTAAANRLTGNSTRARELQRRLATGTAPP